MSTNEGKFFGKVALVTGASRGIGAEIAKKLAAGGAEFIGVHYGSNRDAALKVSFEETSIETFEDVMNTNLKAPYFITQAASPYIRKDGRIINISSGITRVADPSRSIYAASKGAIEALTLSLAPYFASKGVTVNAVRPGITATDMNTEMRSTPEGLARAAAVSAFNRVGTPEDVADVVMFVASEEARWITGQFIDATGGSRL